MSNTTFDYREDKFCNHSGTNDDNIICNQPSPHNSKIMAPYESTSSPRHTATASHDEFCFAGRVTISDESDNIHVDYNMYDADEIDVGEDEDEGPVDEGQCNNVRENGLDDGSSDDDNEKYSETMTLLPPPPSWFQFENKLNHDDFQNNNNQQKGPLQYFDELRLTAAPNEQVFSEFQSAFGSPEDASTGETMPGLREIRTNYSSEQQSQSSNEDQSSIVKSKASTATLADSNTPSSDLFANVESKSSLIYSPESPDAQMFDLAPFSSFPQHHNNQPVAPYSALNDGRSSTNYVISTNNNSSSLTFSEAVDSLSQTVSTAVSQTLPTFLQECSTSAIQKAYHKIRLEYTRLVPHQRKKRASDLGSVGGYFKPPTVLFDSIDENSANPSRDDEHKYDVDTNSARGKENQQLLIDISNSVALGKGRDNHMDWMWMDGTEVRFTTLPWIERQLVHEWRTYEWTTSSNIEDLEESVEVEKKVDSGDASHISLNSVHSSGDFLNEKDILSDEERVSDENEYMEKDDDGVLDDDISSKQDEDVRGLYEDDDMDVGEYERARALVPRPLPRPEWEHAYSCFACERIFGPTLHRHHCRRCGHSFCNAHSNHKHRLPHLGYDCEVPERVCRSCKVVLDSRDLEERVAWRLARCRDFLEGNLTPYFETGIDTVEDAAYRLTRVAISLARSIPLGAQAYVAVETVEVLRKHGLKGVYGLLLRKEFLAAADLLCRVLGINKKNWPLSVHELSAAIFYALAQHRALRGLNPDGEDLIHSLKDDGSYGEVDKNGECWLVSDVSQTNRLPVVREEKCIEDDEAGDDVVWKGDLPKLASSDDLPKSVLDETDVYDPNSERVVDIISMSNPKRKLACSKSKGIREEKAVDVQQRSMDSNIEKGVNVSNLNKDDHKTNPDRGSDLPFDPVCETVSDSLLSSLLFYAPLALNFIYAECEVDMQLLAAQQGWRLVYASLDQSHHHSGEPDSHGHENNEDFSDKPASALFAHDEHKIACLSIRGTATIQDVVTDIRAMPVPFPQQDSESNVDDDIIDSSEEWTSVFRGRGLALCGMAGAALNLFRENADALFYLALKGYKIRIVGHSLGGGVAALLGVLMSRHFEKRRIQKQSPVSNTSHFKDDGFIRVYGFGTPSCVDAKLADFTIPYVTNVVLHDDVVPRLTPTSIRGLLKHLLYVRETWVKAHLSDDLSAITERAYHVWPTRLRGSFTLLKKKGMASAKRLKKSYKKRIKGQEKPSIPVSESNKNLRDRNGKDCEREYSDEFLQPHNWEEANNEEMSKEEGPQTITEMVDFSSVTEETSVDEGVDIEGDLFFDPVDDPLNASDDESSVEQEVSPIESKPKVECDNDWVPFDEPPMEDNCDKLSADTTGQDAKSPVMKEQLQLDDENKESTSVADTPPQMLEEFPLPRMFIPGKIVHIYTHRGGYKAAFVPRKFRQLRRISLAGNMLSDHMAKAYYESLLEVKSIRVAKQDLPSWVGFDEDCTCACCASLFTWASTSNTEAQAARDKHNCRSCGGLVCDPCSKKRVPIPSIGITVPVRVCDRCYNGWGSLYGDVSFERDSQVSIDERDEKDKSAGKKSAPPSRRSAVVDELVSRIPSVSS